MKALYNCGVGHWLKNRHRKRGEVPILLFHRVSPEPDPFWPPLHPEVFRKILAFFKKHYRFLSMKELYEADEPPADSAFISFDDAFQDFEDHALPILQDLELPATLFVPSGSIDSGEAIWPSLVDRYVEAKWETTHPYLELSGGSIHWGGWRSLGKESCTGRLKRTVMEMSYEEQCELKEQLEGNGYSRKIFPMCWKSLKALPSSIELGAHTVRHPYLPSVKDEWRIDREMVESKERIEKMTGRDVNSFAYPFGGFDERCVRIASEHFKMAFTTEPQMVTIRKLSPHRIQRIDLNDPDPKEAFLRVNGLHQALSST